MRRKDHKDDGIDATRKKIKETGRQRRMKKRKYKDVRMSKTKERKLKQSGRRNR